jgi:hypothetical protein
MPGIVIAVEALAFLSVFLAFFLFLSFGLLSPIQTTSIFKQIIILKLHHVNIKNITISVMLGP